jgi:bifunctional DNA-binding transcriptional regulator/antitoxin component of YhaV-PrlF toxin-antitoxin module
VLKYLPHVGKWEMSVVELDDKGRVLIPAEIRRRVKATRFKVSVRGNVVELEPLDRVESLRGKYRDVIRHDWEELEEMGEEYVTKR